MQGAVVVCKVMLCMVVYKVVCSDGVHGVVQGVLQGGVPGGVQGGVQDGGFVQKPGDPSHDVSPKGERWLSKVW